MDDGRLNEIRKRVEMLRPKTAIGIQDIIYLTNDIRDLLASHDTQAARIAELQGEVEAYQDYTASLKDYLETALTIHANGCECDEKCSMDETANNWCSCFCHRAKDIIAGFETVPKNALRTRLAALEQAAGEVADNLDECIDESIEFIL